MEDLDNAMEVQEAYEARERGERPSLQKSPSKEFIGTVEGFFSKINVVAIRLSSTLKVGDTIEIGNDESSVRQKITSMQIDRKDVAEAISGDSIGIKIGYKVLEGSEVYRI